MDILMVGVLVLFYEGILYLGTRIYNAYKRKKLIDSLTHRVELDKSLLKM